jgi:hypothetical protein
MPSKNTYFATFSTHYNDTIKEDYYKEKENKRLRPDWEYYLKPPSDDLQSKHAVMDKIRKFLDDYTLYGVKRSAKQIEFHNKMLATSAVTIYGEALFKKYKRQICLRYGWTSEMVFHLLSIMASRRFGKSHAFAMFIVAHLLCVPKTECSIFAPTDVQSSMLLSHVKWYYQLRADDGFKVIDNNKRHFTVSPNAADLRKVHAWPSGVNVSDLYIYL